MKIKQYIVRSNRDPAKAPERLAGWYGNELWLWRGRPQKLTLVATMGPCRRGLTIRRSPPPLEFEISLERGESVELVI